MVHPPVPRKAGDGGLGNSRRPLFSWLLAALAGSSTDTSSCTTRTCTRTVKRGSKRWNGLPDDSPRVETVPREDIERPVSRLRGPSPSSLFMQDKIGVIRVLALAGRAPVPRRRTPFTLGPARERVLRRGPVGRLRSDQSDCTLVAHGPRRPRRGARRQTHEPARYYCPPARPSRPAHCSAP